MLFDWDPKKARLNYKKHKVSFEEAATVFYDPLSATFEAPDHSRDEDRFITIGYSSKSNLVVLAHTEKGNVIRIISARYATANEREKHETSE